MCHSATAICMVLLVTSDAPADQRSRNQLSHILTNNTQLNQLKHPSTITACFANPATLARTQYVAMPPAPVHLSDSAQHNILTAPAFCWGRCRWWRQEPVYIRLLVIRAGIAGANRVRGSR